jgi:hypothetical protein
MSAARELAAMRAPDEPAAQARAWEVVRSAHRDRSPVVQRRPGWRLALAPAVIALLAALALTPAAATVGRLISHALGVPHAARALFSLPAPGRLLVSGPGGTWLVSADGSRRRLGPWPQASWSPHGRYIAVAAAGELAAVNPQGVTQWALARRAVKDPRWYPPTGFRVAYRSGSALRVVAGDGTGDHLLAASVAPVAPAWRPDHPYQLAYAQRDRVIVRDADSGRVIWTRHAVAVRKLDWSVDGSRLLVLSEGGVEVLAATGRTIAAIPTKPDQTTPDASLSPNGQLLALVRNGDGPGVLVAQLRSRRPTLVTLLAGPAIQRVAWSPNGRWLLASWPAADQWVFVAVNSGPQIAAVSHITRQFATHPRADRFPQIDGWCCTAPRPGG